MRRCVFHEHPYFYQCTHTTAYYRCNCFAQRCCFSLLWACFLSQTSWNGCPRAVGGAALWKVVEQAFQRKWAHKVQRWGGGYHPWSPKPGTPTWLAVTARLWPAITARQVTSVNTMQTNFTPLTSSKILTWTNKWPELGKHVPHFLVCSFICFIKFISISTAPLLIISLRNPGFPEMNLMAPIQYKKASELACRSSFLRTSNNDSAKKRDYHTYTRIATDGMRHIKVLIWEHQTQFVKR